MISPSWGSARIVGLQSASCIVSHEVQGIKANLKVPLRTSVFASDFVAIMRVLYSVYALGAFAFAARAATIPSGMEFNSTIYRRAGNPDDVTVEDIPQEGGDCNGK